MRGRIDFGDIDPGGNLPIDANLQLTGGGSIITTANGNITLLPNGSGITIVGDAGSTSHSLAANDDLFVTGKLEVDGNLYIDGTSNEITKSLTIENSSSTSELLFGDGDGGTPGLILRADYDQWGYFLTSACGMALTIANRSYASRDYDHAVQTNPTLYIQSAADPDSDNTQWMSLTHDQTDSLIASGKGKVHITPASGSALSVGTDGALQGILELWDGAGGNTPGNIKIHSPNGTAWYLFVEDDGTVKVHNAAPTQNSDGSAVGDQTD